MLQRLNMSSSNISIIEKFGLGCPKGGKPYICAGEWTEFLGCCKSDACSFAMGCPKEDVTLMSFNRSYWELISPQTCQSHDPKVQFWVCGVTKPSFIGCCSSNACETGLGCPSEDLSTMILGYDSTFRSLTVNSIRYPQTFPTISGRNSTSSVDWGALKTKELVGISAGLLLLAIISLVFVWKQVLTR